MFMKKIQDRILTILMIIVFIFVLFLGAYVFLCINHKVHTNTTTSDFDTKLIDNYNYINDYSDVINNSNKNMIEQYSTMSSNNSVISQLTIETMMYNIANKDGKKINTLFKRYNNGYKSWEEANKIFLGTNIFYPSSNTNFTVDYVNDLISTELGKQSVVFDDSDKELLETASALGLYYRTIEFEEPISGSVVDKIQLSGMFNCTSTKNLDLIKLRLKDNKTAIVVMLKDESKNNLKDYLSELGDLTELKWYEKDTQINITPFSLITSGIPGSVLNDIKDSAISWDEKFNDLVVVNYVECNNNSYNSIANNNTNENIEESANIDNEEVDLEYTYAESYNLDNNFIILIQDNNTKLIECICDVE